MTQLILDVGGSPVTLPESQKQGYKAYKEPGFVSVEMITRRTVLERRGDLWVVNYQYGFFTDDMKNQVIAACEKGRAQAILCSFLPPTSTGELLTSKFFVTEFNYPSFMWSRSVTTADGTTGEPYPMWADFSMVLREVQPSD